MSKEKLIPDLRFPEFENEGEWEEKRISQLGDTVNGLTGKSGEDFGTGKPYVTYKQVFANSIIDFDKCGKVQISESENQNTLKKGDILLTTSSETPNEVGYASVLVESPIEPTYLNSFCFSIRPFDIEETQPQFSRYLFHSPVYRKSVSALAQGSTRYNLSKGAFLNLKLPLPKPQEQQKIASCLSSLDEVIAAHNQKLDILKDHKKGLMQNLFPQEGEKVPKYRFKEFENEGEWQEYVLSEITDAIFDGTHQTPSYTESGIPFFSVENIVSGNKNKFISKEDYEIATNKNKPEKGDVLLTRIGKIGFSAIVDWEYEFSIYVTLACIKQSKHFNSYYLHSYFQSSIYQKEIFSKSLLNAVPMKINMEELRKTKVLLPPDKEKKEQQKIASCLSSLDALIAAQAEKIEQLKLHKKGLMQGMFPKSITN